MAALPEDRDSLAAANRAPDNDREARLANGLVFRRHKSEPVSSPRTKDSWVVPESHRDRIT